VRDNPDGVRRFFNIIHFPLLCINPRATYGNIRGIVLNFSILNGKYIDQQGIEIPKER